MMGERTLIRRARSGDSKACATLVRTHYAPIYRMLAALTRDVHLAEDLCQETFAAAWKSSAAFDGRSSLGTWLHAIAYRKFLDAQRRERVDVEPVESAQVVDPLAGLVMDEEERALHVAIDQMGEKERDVIVLHYLQQMSYREMSAVLAEPVGTVKWRTKSAIEKLRTLLIGEGDAEKRNEKTGETSAGTACGADS
jgi:RNA polymerase sigma-70 factor (ECF subfamily)